jgi:group I intron endonuclease
MRCIYRIDINDRYYIGSTIDFENRKRLHLLRLRKQYHSNKFLQNLYNKYGGDSFKFSIIELLNDDVDVLKAEQPYLDEHFGKENCVNLSPIAGGGFYYIRTPEIIQKQLVSRMKNGNWFSAANYNPKEAIAANIGSKRSKEFCENMSIIKKDQYKNNPEQLKILNEKDRAEINKIKAEAYAILQSTGYSEQDKSRLLKVEIGKMRAEIKRMGMETQRLKEEVKEKLK